MPTISLCMIVKNEENLLANCLESVKDLVEEIIIVDTGSTDNTKEIAQQFTDKIFDFKWIDNFSTARNYSFAQANMDYQFWLDADDILLADDRGKFLKLKRDLNLNVDFVMMKYNTGFDDQGNVTFSYFRERLSKRSLNTQWAEPVHEYLQMTGKVIMSDICITHQKKRSSIPGRNIKIYEKILAEGKELTPRGLYYFARELKDHGRYNEAIKYFNVFLDSGKGWVEDNINACAGLAYCYQQKKEDEMVLVSLCRSFGYAVPRAEICCQIGYYFKAKNDYVCAVFWFRIAENLEKPKNSWGFVQDDFWGFIPCIELCVCYYYLGNLQKAIAYNNKAAEYKPDHPAVLYNKNYFLLKG